MSLSFNGFFEFTVNNNATFPSWLNLINFNALNNFTYNTSFVFLEASITGRSVIKLIILTNVRSYYIILCNFEL